MSEASNFDLESVRVLIHKARDGDQSAQSDLVQQIHGYVTMMADKRLDRSLRANVNPSDIVQQTMIQMVNGIRSFRGDSKEEFFGWINQIVKNESANVNRQLKRKKRDIRRQTSLEANDSSIRPAHGLRDYNPTPKTNAISKERIELFHAALKELSAEHAEVIRLRNLEQLPFKDVAEKMGRSVDSVSKLWYRAVVKFQQELSKLDVDK